MSIRQMKLEKIPNEGWLKRKKAPSWLLDEIDTPSKDPDCITIENGEGWLGYIVLNNLGVSGQRPSIPGGCYRVSIKEIEPSKGGKHPRWSLQLNDIEVIITKAAKDQWSLFDQFRDCEPYCAMVATTRVTLVFIAREKSVLGEARYWD